MPRFHFYLRADGGRIPDEEGSDLPALEAARAEAIESARELMAQAILKGYDISGQSIEIRDGGGRLLLEVPFTEAIIRP